MTIPAGQDAEMSDTELLRRAVAYTRPLGYAVVEKGRAVGMMVSLNEAAAQRLCKRFGSTPTDWWRDDRR
jgi:hypothetical protein